METENKNTINLGIFSKSNPVIDVTSKSVKENDVILPPRTQQSETSEKE